MKTIKISIQILLSLLLIPCIICSCLLFNASAFFQKDNISGILSELSSGNRILRYEYLSEDKDEDDFYAKLAETIPVQVALVVDISSENARICQEGAFEHIKELDLQSFVYNSLDLLANELATGYTQTAIDKKIINPNAYISYLNVHHERVTDTKKNLLMDTMYQKYRTILIGLDDENYFCALNADGRNTFLYILSSGRKAAETFMKNLKVAAIETHVADARTCCLHPANATHRQLTDKQLEEAGIPATLVRYSCGIENADDLIEDIAQALEKI